MQYEEIILRPPEKSHTNLLKLIFFSIFLTMYIYIFYGIFHFEGKFEYKNLPAVCFLVISIMLTVRVCLTIIPDLYVDFLERGVRISMDEEGVIDNRISQAKMNWAIFSTVEILGNPMSGVSTVRLRKKKGEHVQYRKFRIESLLRQKIGKDDFIYVNIKYFTRDPKYISENLKFLFEKATKA